MIRKVDIEMAPSPSAFPGRTGGLSILASRFARKKRWPFVSPRLLTLLNDTSNILLLTHHNPDGDALSSAVAMATALKNKSRRVDLHISGSHPENIDFLLSPDIAFSDLSNLDFYGLLVFLDCHTADRLGDESAAVIRRFLAANATPVAVIDHHILEDGQVPTDTWVLQTSASSTAELVFYVLKELEVPLPPKAVEALLAGLVSDTGAFTQSNTTAAALAAASELVAAGGSLETVHQKLTMNRPARRVKLMGLVFSTLELHLGGRLATVTMTDKMLAKAKAESADSEGFIDQLKNIAGVGLSALVREAGDGRIKVSLRSHQPQVNAAALARSFGGGGHRPAAAYVDPEAESVREAVKRLTAAAPPYLRGDIA